MTSFKGGWILLVLNGNQPSLARVNWLFSSVDPQIKEAPKPPNSAHPQSDDMAVDMMMSRKPNPMK